MLAKFIKRVNPVRKKEPSQSFWMARFSNGVNINYSRGGFLALLGVVLAVSAIGFLFFLDINMSQKRARLNSQLAAIQKDIEELRNKNEELKEELPKMQDSDYIEKTAREDLNLQRPGETVVGFILPEDKAVEQENAQNWMQKLLNWVKGKF